MLHLAAPKVQKIQPQKIYVLSKNSESVVKADLLNQECAYNIGKQHLFQEGPLYFLHDA